MAYESLAEWFEFLNDDCDYPAWSQYFIETLARLGAGRYGLEIGCGSGAFTRALTKAGYRMSGSDVSSPMLTKAAALAGEEGLDIFYFLSDARTLKTPEKYDFIISANDCYNYIETKALPSAFRRAAAALKPSGVFHFDVSSACKLREKVANNMFADDRDEVTFLSMNRLFSDRVETDVTLFVRQADGRFVRSDERHVLYIHEEEEIVRALEGAGFTVLSVEGHLGAPAAGSDRLNFICRKVSSTKR